jgi:hypothetical protein
MQKFRCVFFTKSLVLQTLSQAFSYNPVRLAFKTICCNRMIDGNSECILETSCYLLEIIGN